MDYKISVNPTFSTAKNTVIMLAKAGNKNAKRVIDGLGISETLAKFNDTENPFSEEDTKALLTGVTLAVEARYASVTHILSQQNRKSLFDIACGYTPRALYCKQNGIDYIGLDVPVVAEELQKLAVKEELGDVYIGGDATNEASLLKAASKLKKDVLVSTEGLLQYLFKAEFAEMLYAIRQVLKEHGGVWVSSDMGVDYEAFATVNMSGPEARENYRELRKKALQETNIFNNGVAFWDEVQMESFIETRGFKVEKLPFYHGDEDLTILKTVPEEWKEGYISVLNKSQVWKMTLDSDYAEKDRKTGSREVDNLSIVYMEFDDMLKVSVKGRIDTISAPALLEIFDQCVGEIATVTIDAKKLEYISSAGLRTLLFLVKRLGFGSVKMIHASEEVMDILETTGFDKKVIVE